MQVFRLSQNGYKNCSLLLKVLVGDMNPQILLGAGPPDPNRSSISELMRTSLTPLILATLAPHFSPDAR